LQGCGGAADLRPDLIHGGTDEAGSELID